MIGNPCYTDLVPYQGGIVGRDSNTGQIHIFCDCGNTLYYTNFRFELFQNYPNPFNAVTRIQYTVSTRQIHPTHTTLKIYNILGKEVRGLLDTRQSSGNYTIIWDGKNDSGKGCQAEYTLIGVGHVIARRPESWL
jgi:hypothetical protein